MDAVNLHIQARLAMNVANGDSPPFVAIRLADGGSNGDLYDSRADAVRMTANDMLPSFYVAIGAAPMPFREAVIVLQMNRRAYAHGIRFIDTDVVTPQRTELLGALLPNTLRRLDRGTNQR